MGNERRRYGPLSNRGVPLISLFPGSFQYAGHEKGDRPSAGRPLSPRARTPAGCRRLTQPPAPEQIDRSQQDDRAQKGRQQRPPVKGGGAKVAAPPKAPNQEPAEDRPDTAPRPEKQRVE